MVGGNCLALHFIQRSEPASRKFYNADFKMVMVFIVRINVPVPAMAGKVLIHSCKHMLTLSNVVFAFVSVVKHIYAWTVQLRGKSVIAPEPHKLLRSH